MRKKKWLALIALAILSLSLVGGAAALHVLRKHRLATSEEPVPKAPKSPRSQSVALAVYDGRLVDGWADWGWGPHELPNAGPAKVQFRGFGGIIFRHELVTQRYGGLLFRYKAPADWPPFLLVSLKNSEGGAALGSVPVNAENALPTKDGWYEVWIGFDELNPDGVPFDRIVISARSSVGADWVLLDKVALTKLDAGAAEASAPSRGTELAIQCRAPTHPIDPLIYGSALGDWESGQTAQRIGGNPTSRANWDLKAWNVAKDWFFENTKSTDNDELIESALVHGASTALTVPMIGWVAKDTSSVGFPAAKFPRQRKFDPNRPDVGDGFLPDGKPIAPGPPTETSLPAPPELIGRWVRELRERDRARNKRGVGMYILDNEPSLWSDTHRDVHPAPLSYDELLDRTLRYATAIRAADPETPIAGPAEWGWLGYLYSARDLATSKLLRPDRRTHGDVPLIPWYLQKIAEHERATGLHLLDVLDVHYYPAAPGMIGGNDRVDAEGAALRIRSTRSLWDPEYRDESWIDEQIGLIPRLKGWVAANHPGLRISLGEWNFGGENHISGGLAAAEALGRFGQQGLDAAFFWGGPKAGSAVFWAFRAFRNFDGQGGRFLDESLKTRESKQVSLFASRDAAHGHLVAVAINRDPTSAASALIRLDACGAFQTTRSFVYTRGSAGLAEVPSKPVENGALRATIPPYSIMVFDVRGEPGDAAAK